MMEGPDERMRAVLGPATRSHPRAAATLLEGLALGHQQALFVVPCADVLTDTSPLRLEDAFGFGVRNVHFEVEVALRQRGDVRAASPTLVHGRVEHQPRSHPPTAGT
jgi:hypothetical protein